MININIDQEMFYDSIAEEWEDFIDLYDTGRRIEVLLDNFLADLVLQKLSVLEVGPGLGFFTKKLLEKGASKLTCLDIAPRLIKKIKEAFPTVECITGDVLNASAVLGERQFDVIVCSEVIEHTSNPQLALEQLAKLMAPDSILLLTVPNKRWFWLLKVAVFLRLRKNYKGYENWICPKQLLHRLDELGLHISKISGIHIVPWQIIPKCVLRWLDERTKKFSYYFAINLAVKCQKPKTS